MCVCVCVCVLVRVVGMFMCEVSASVVSCVIAFCPLA